MNKPPVRLLDSPDLSSAERTLLDAARSVPPVHYDAVAGAAKLQATLATLPASTAVTTVAAKSLTAIKLAAVMIPVLGAATYYATWSSTEAASVDTKPPVVQRVPSVDGPPEPTSPAPDAQLQGRRGSAVDAPEQPGRPSRQTAVADARHRTATHAVRPIPVATAPAPEPGPSRVTEPAIDAPVAPEAPHESPAEEAPEAPTATSEPAPVSESINELRGIAQARTLLERDAAASLSLLQRLERAHPKGYFVEERLALTVIALARTGDDESARSRAIRFLRSYPKSPFADRVRAAVQ